MKGFLLIGLMATAMHGHALGVNPYSLVERMAAQYHIEPELIAAFIDVESGWNPRAMSSKGALGLMQLMPATAQRFGAFDPFDPEENIAAGTRYLTTLMWKFRGDERLVAAAFYAGEQRIDIRQLKYRNVDVIAYVELVRKHYLQRKHMTGNLSEQ